MKISGLSLLVALALLISGTALAESDFDFDATHLISSGALLSGLLKLFGSECIYIFLPCHHIAPPFMSKSPPPAICVS